MDPIDSQPVQDSVPAPAAAATPPQTAATAAPAEPTLSDGGTIKVLGADDPTAKTNDEKAGNAIKAGMQGAGLAMQHHVDFNTIFGHTPAPDTSNLVPKGVQSSGGSGGLGPITVDRPAGPVPMVAPAPMVGPPPLVSDRNLKRNISQDNGPLIAFLTGLIQNGK